MDSRAFGFREELRTRWMPARQRGQAMSPFIYRLLLMLVSSAVFASSLSASPLNSKLLSLVPPGAEIVAGFENQPRGHKPGRLILATRNDRLDLDDWQALAGVDSKRVIDEVIEVAASSSTGRLTEHLVLLAGRFDKERIFSSAELNGAERSEWEGQAVTIIQPFAREEKEMPDTRWLIILNNRIAMLGTPLMVQRALHRYTTHADIDMPLMERLAQMRPDVTSWNVLIASPKANNNPIITRQASVLTRLIDGAEVLMVGTCFGPKVRVDFSLHAPRDRETVFFKQKASFFADVFAKEPHGQSSSHQPSRGRLGSFSFEPNHIEGSIELSSKEFQEWIQLGGFTRPLQGSISPTPGRGE